MNNSMLKFCSLFLFLTVFIVSCTENVELQDKTITYQFHNGQTVPTAPYAGYHSSDLTADMTIEELEDDRTRITVELNNTLDGETYHIHAHDAADASTTPNGTPYNESPNGDVLAGMVVGNGGSVSLSQETDMTYEEITSSYEGFFVVHDPLQAINTADITSYVIVGAFAKDQTSTSLNSTTFAYDFNTGQVAEAFAYVGSHSTDFNSTITIDELVDGRSRVTVIHNNTMDGMVYPTHSHDMADADTTPNGTPYLETPNGNVFAGAIMGNGGTNGLANISSLSYDELTTTYDGFFVVHDPLQDVDTTDPTTYIILGVFGR